MTSIKHHYTPRYYLKRFENEDGKIWRLDVETGVIVPGNHDRFGYKNHWNRLKNPPPGFESDWAEKQIAQIDGNSAFFIKQLVEGKFPPDIRPIAHAIGFMKIHQPRLHRELTSEHTEQVANWTSDFKLIASLKAALQEGRNLEPLSYSIIRLDETEKHSRFLTSSNPLVDFENMPNKFFPLSSRDCLMLIYDPELAHNPPCFVTGSANLVRQINEISLRNAWQYVYSCRSDFEP